MVMSSPSIQPLLAWSIEELAQYGSGLAALAVLAACSGRIRNAVNGGRLGTTVSQQSVPAAMRLAIVSLPVGFWLLSLWASQAHETSFMQATIEDGWLEDGQGLLLVCSVVTSGLVARSLWKRRQRMWAWAYLLLAVALCWVMGEEISWGQRALHLPTPAWLASHNTQEELNLHNLTGVDTALSEWADRGVSWLTFLSATA